MLKDKVRNDLLDNIKLASFPVQFSPASQGTITPISANVLTEVEISEALLRGDVHMEFMDEAPSTMPMREIVSFGVYNGRKVRLRAVDVGKIRIDETTFGTSYAARIAAHTAKIESYKAQVETMSQKIKRWMW